MIKHILFIKVTAARLCGLLMALAILPIPVNESLFATMPSSARLSRSEHSDAPVQKADAFTGLKRAQDAETIASRAQSLALADSTPPVINVWYGSSQSFTLGAPQNWLNILGDVNDPESGVASLSYTLNGSAYHALSIGPDWRRLAHPGDFNIDIALSDGSLHSGSNTLNIQAVNGAGLSAQSNVQFSYTAGKIWSMPYGVYWNSVSNIQQAVQVVDGKWQVVPGGVRTVETGYDRVLAIGDLAWKDYEILVPVTINAVDTSKYGDPIGIDPGIGVNLRWTGHTDSPVQCAQPKCGWDPTGASVWYEFFSNSSYNNFSLQAYPPNDTPSNPIPFITGGKYWIRAHVETNPSGSLYKAKAWADGSAEPDWMFIKQADQTNLNHGSLLLVAHYVDATFGDISIAPVSAKLYQQINITQHAPASAVYGSSFTVAAAATSGLPVSYSSGSPSICTNTNGGATFTVTATSGTCVVLYDQPGSAAYSPAAQLKDATTVEKVSQTISFAPISDKTYGDPSFTVSASASSGLPVHFQAAGSCAVAGNMVSINGAGSCAVTASQPGSDIYAPAPDVPVTFMIAKAKALVAMGGLFHTYDGTPKPASVTVTPSGLSGVTVTYNGSGAAPADAGSYAVTAELANPNYEAITVTGTLVIAKANQTITIVTQAPARLAPGASFTIMAASSSPGLQVTYTSGSPGVCTNQGSAFTSTGRAGNCIILIDQAGDKNHNPAPQAREVVVIAAPFFLPFLQSP